MSRHEAVPLLVPCRGGAFELMRVGRSPRLPWGSLAGTRAVAAQVCRLKEFYLSVLRPFQPR